MLLLPLLLLVLLLLLPAELPLQSVSCPPSSHHGVLCKILEELLLCLPQVIIVVELSGLLVGKGGGGEGREGRGGGVTFGVEEGEMLACLQQLRHAQTDRPGEGGA